MKSFNTIKNKFNEKKDEFKFILDEELKNKGLDATTIDLLIKMLELDPNKRINIENAINHEYFKVEPKMCEKNEIPLPKTDDFIEMNVKNELKFDEMKIGENFNNEFLNKKRNKDS